MITLAGSSFPDSPHCCSAALPSAPAALHDIAARTVPNWMAGLLTLLGVASQLLHFPQYSGFLASLIVFLAAAICWRRGWLGGGDVKLLAAAHRWSAAGQRRELVAAVALAGGCARGGLSRLRAASCPQPATGPAARASDRSRLRVEQWRIRRGGPLPYALAIAAGVLFMLL